MIARASDPFARADREVARHRESAPRCWLLGEAGPDDVSAWCILPDGTFEAFALPASEGQAESIAYSGDGRLVIAVLVANDRGDGYDLLVTAFDI